MNAALLVMMVAAFSQVGDRPSAAPYPSEPAAGDPTFDSGPITSEHDAIISAEVEGVLTQLSVKEGTRLEQGEVFATIDDRQAQAAVEVARYTHQAAAARAEDRIEEVFAKASADYARVDLLKDQTANQGTPNAVPDITIRQKKLAVVRADLQTQKAQKDRLIALKEADVKKAELKAAQIALDRRTLRAPFAGEVQQLMQKQAQWVNPGDPILRLVKFDVLRVECLVSANDYDPIELASRAVTVRVPLARGREVAVEGKVVHVGQTVEPNQRTYLVRAEIENQRQGAFWLIRPGMTAQMTIHTSRPPVDAPAKSASLP
jgi:multidrug efflux pump subunit AcrA (membrane-fusion protein)